MNIPNLPNHPVIDDNKMMHSVWHDFFSQLITDMQNNLSNEGYKVPQQPTATVTALNTDKSKGALLYDNQTDELKVNINGTFKTVQTV